MRVRLNTLVDLTGFGWRTIKKRLAEASIIPVGRESNANVYDSAAALRCLYADPERTDDLDLSSERARLAKEQADRAAMQNAQTRQELMPVAVMTVALARVSAQVAARLDGVPGRLRMRMRHWQPSDFDAIEEEIAAARNLAAQVTVEAEDFGTSDDQDSDQ